ncbi:MAG: S-layer homology domain-containing protein [Clostridia bacterium]|nr:S-layer homology domain-containing protein [Clostridia bacterium]
MKKILSLFLAILMSLSVASMIGAAEEVPAIEAEATPELIATKEDVSIYDEAIQYLTEYGILHGKEDGLPHAEDAIKRYEMALFVARISTGWVDDAQWKVWWVGSDATVAEEWYDREHDVTGFTDLEGSGAANFLGALSYAAQKGIILGYGDGKFGPEDGIRYEDALTMLCRVLEYNNLEWPWGYIEKAVNLGLTKGIPSTVAYRDRLNRGEVAQLIYNALFAEMKNGGTLASRYFNGALEWKNIIITGAGYGRLLPNDLLTDKHELYDLGDYIAFRIVDEKDGSLDASKTYFVNNKDLNWLDKRYERYLGFAYKALFTVDENGYATLYHVKDLKGDTVKNRGRLAKVDDAYPIDTFLKNRTLVSKFTLKGTYLNNYNEKYNPSANEFILRNALQAVYEDDDQSKKIAVNWNNGDNNIVVYESKDGVVTKKVETIWYWNSELRCYFSVLFDKDGNYYGIKILDADEIAKLLASTNKHDYLGGLNIIAPDKPGTTAYADLTPFKLLDDPDYNYGLYEAYGIGKFNTETKAIDAEGKEKNGFSVSGLESLGSFFWDKKYYSGEASYPEDYTNYKVGKIPTEGKGILGWINDKEGLVPADGDYIIYSFDEATRELKVIKIINDKTFDENNYIGSGVLRGWKLADKSFNIDGKTFNFDYNELLGNGLKIHDGDSIYEKNAFTNFFRGLFNQYVKFLVVDDKVVHMWKSGYTNDLIVVDSYAGLSSDGYIVINGYNTADLKYQQFKIGSYNGWVKGDYFYYPDQATVDEAFGRGTIYKLTSIDKSGADPIYYVYTIAITEWDDNLTWDNIPVEGVLEYSKGGYVGGWYYDFSNLDSAYADDGVYPKYGWTIDFSGGYKQINGGDWVKAKSSDKYIFICNEPGYDYPPIIVWQGKGGDNWHAQGTLVNGKDADDVHVVVDAILGKWLEPDANGDRILDTRANVFGHDQWDLSYVLFVRYNYDSGRYDSTYADGSYLLGASTFTATVLNLYTGKEMVVNAINKDLKKGYAYPCINNFIVEDGRGTNFASTAPYDAKELNKVITDAYPTNTKYIFGGAPDKVGDLDIFDKEAFSKAVLTKNPAYKISEPALSAGVKDLSSENIVILIDADDTGRITGWTRLGKMAELKAALSDKDGNLLYDWNDVKYWYVSSVGGSTVIYVSTPATKVAAPSEFKTEVAKVVDFTQEYEAAKDPAYVVPYIYGTKTATSATINAIGLQFRTGPHTHGNIISHKLYFGNGGYETIDQETMEVAVDNQGYFGPVHVAYYEDDIDENHDHVKGVCELVKEIKAPALKPKTVKAPTFDEDKLKFVDEDGNELTATAAADKKTATVSGKKVTITVDLADDVSSTDDKKVKSTLEIEVWWEATYKVDQNVGGTAIYYDLDGEPVVTYALKTNLKSANFRNITTIVDYSAIPSTCK